MARTRRKRVQTAFVILMLVLVAGLTGLFLLSIVASRPQNLGVHNGRLAPCPDSPNCVATQTEDHEHWIAPLTYSSDSDNVINVLEAIVRQQPRTTVIEKKQDYLYVEFRSAFFRFTDDVEFYAEAESGRVHFRSASRVGRSDLGVNRARMERIRRVFLAKPLGVSGRDVLQ